MSRHCREIYDQTRHHNPMLGAGAPPDETPDRSILPRWVFFVAVAGFTFEFHSLEHIGAALDYFSLRVHPSSRILNFPSGAMDHWEAQRWFDRIPMRLMKERRRIKVVKALSAALEEFGGGRGAG